MERGNVALALSIYEAMCRARPGAGRSSGAGEVVGTVSWPHASLETVSAVVRAKQRLHHELRCLGSPLHALLGALPHARF